MINKLYIKREYHKSLTKICPQCNKPFKVYYSRDNRYTFCSLTCRKMHNAKKRNEKAMLHDRSICHCSK